MMMNQWIGGVAILVISMIFSFQLFAQEIQDTEENSATGDSVELQKSQNLTRPSSMRGSSVRKSPLDQWLEKNPDRKAEFDGNGDGVLDPMERAIARRQFFRENPPRRPPFANQPQLTNQPPGFGMRIPPNEQETEASDPSSTTQEPVQN